jgi:uncharacterized protein (TIGR02001 family)
MKTVVRGFALLLLASTAHADFSANLGYASEYHYRGIFQKNSSASGGIDYESGGFSAGTWAADVGDGLEVDGYFGYGTSIGEIDFGVAAIFANDDLVGDAEESIVLTIGKSFDIN